MTLNKRNYFFTELSKIRNAFRNEVTWSDLLHNKEMRQVFKRKYEKKLHKERQARGYVKLEDITQYIRRRYEQIKKSK